MPHLLKLPTHTDHRGNLTVIERELNFEIKRVFFIYGVDDSVRAGHRHKTTIQALICLQGSCKIHNNNGTTTEDFILNSKSKCLILFPEDWHEVLDFTHDCILIVFASTPFSKADYIYKPY